MKRTFACSCGFQFRYKLTGPKAGVIDELIELQFIEKMHMGLGHTEVTLAEARRARQKAGREEPTP